MNQTLRRIAVSGGAAIALLGGPAVITANAEEHHATVVAVAEKQPVPNPSGLTTDPGSGAQLQNPVGGQPAGVNGEQIQTQAGGGAIGAGIVAILVLGVIVFVRVKNGPMRVGDAVLVTLFGIAISGTVVGAMGDSLTESAISSLGNVLSGL
ncbi:hypothetical protein SGFS_013170 [Streptomyces graminofaciens]|uniref:Secreted protein n=1 Tax=Streptomyces graminofaciens TaxID=68212 RepID=A0ABN5V9R3_9ACTN|nr:hypothetical protein [Streptomyces graminofaciens]BBC30023.1 hypothetical protein SGFS_013170 [Streptomyces graminofaciens]